MLRGSGGGVRQGTAPRLYRKPPAGDGWKTGREGTASLYWGRQEWDLSPDFDRDRGRHPGCHEDLSKGEAVDEHHCLDRGRTDRRRLHRRIQRREAGGVRRIAPAAPAAGREMGVAGLDDVRLPGRLPDVRRGWALRRKSIEGGHPGPGGFLGAETIPRWPDPLATVQDPVCPHGG